MFSSLEGATITLALPPSFPRCPKPRQTHGRGKLCVVVGGGGESETRLRTHNRIDGTTRHVLYLGTKTEVTPVIARLHWINSITVWLFVCFLVIY